MAITVATSSVYNSFKVAMITQPVASGSLYVANLADQITKGWDLIIAYTDGTSHYALFKNKI